MSEEEDVETAGRMYAGPAVLGRRTWFALGRNIPKIGWEYRTISAGSWFDPDRRAVTEQFWYQVRRKLEPVEAVYSAGTWWVSRWREVRDHPQRNLFEWFNSEGKWRRINPRFDAHDEWTVKLRFQDADPEVESVDDDDGIVPVQDGYPVVAVKHLRTLANLGDYERLAMNGAWTRIINLDSYDDEFPMRVRRRREYRVQA